MTRRERTREGVLKLVACLVPTTSVVGAMFALGGKPAAITMLVFGELAALGLATSVRTVRAAVIGGVLLAIALVMMLLFFVYVRSA
jgi:predicted RND superfamily exporter protein